jgi:hypothetical protein
MTGNDPVQDVLDWFNTAGGTVSEEPDEPREVHLSSGQFYVGTWDHDPVVVDVSILLSIFDIDAEEDDDDDVDDADAEQLDRLVEDLRNQAPVGVVIEAGFSADNDIWAAIRLSGDDLRPEALPDRLRTFVDYALQTADQVQDVLHPIDVVQPDPIGGALEALRRLVGVDDLITKAEEFVALARVNAMRRSEGLKAQDGSPHLVFTGNPGTGKTTVARLMGAIYKELGLLDSGHLVEARRSDLIGKYVGQTTPRTERVIEKAMGGVLFIDEAYTLAEGHETMRSYGDECIATLLLAMENHRGKFALIVAGYPGEMNVFLDSNPGLRSRFDQTWHFRDYSTEELVTIVHGYVTKNDFLLADGCDQRLRRVFDAVPRDRYFANARLARETFHAMRRRQAARIVGAGLSGREHLMLIMPDDIVPPAKIRPRPPMGFTSQGQ